MRLRIASTNAPITLAKELGRGGEGAVYLVTGAPHLVAKIYLKPPTAVKVDKLRSMARNTTPALLRVAAWPVDLLADEGGAVRGFLMPKVSAREDVHELYSPKSRRRAFPAVDFRFIVRVAANIARSFAQVHAQGNVIGDVNHGNALVGRDGTVVLIDCDSFQIRDQARLFTCDVGVPLFTPPELAGRVFRGLKRTPDHDAFGLAVLLFHLLYLGRHPFAGKHVAGEMPIERAIAESRFAYGAAAATLGMSPPPGTLSLGVFGPHIAELFERAFAAPAERARPAATEWIGALQALEGDLVACAVSPSHYYHSQARRGPGEPPGSAPGCCWCALEHHTGLKLFGGQLVSIDVLGTAKLAPLWDAITAVPKPEVLPAVEVPPVEDLEARSTDPLGPIPRAILSWVLVFLGIGCLFVQPGEHVLLALMSFGASVALRWKHLKSGWRSDRAQRIHRTMFLARKHFAIVAQEWNDLSRDRRFEEFLAQLENTKRLLLELPKRREASIKALMEDAAQRQRDRFLELFRLDKEKLPQLPSQDVAMLASYDIVTAGDVIRRAADLPDVISLAARLEARAWAEACERKFVFDPARGADAEDVREIDQLLIEQQESLARSLREGREELERLAGEIAGQRAQKQRDLAAARKAMSIALESEQ